VQQAICKLKMAKCGWTWWNGIIVAMCAGEKGQDLFLCQ
jgi:hypothetical protein